MSCSRIHQNSDAGPICRWARSNRVEPGCCVFEPTAIAASPMLQSFHNGRADAGECDSQGGTCESPTSSHSDFYGLSAVTIIADCKDCVTKRRRSKKPTSVVRKTVRLGWNTDLILRQLSVSVDVLKNGDGYWLVSRQLQQKLNLIFRRGDNSGLTAEF